MKRVLVIFFLIASLVGCTKHSSRKEIHFTYPDASRSSFETTIADQLSALSEADPLSDSRDAYKKKDFRLVAVEGIGTSTPGVTLTSTKRLLGPQRFLGLKVVSGTSDMISSPVHDQMIRQAHEYATAYNTHMIILLTTGGKEASASERSVSP